MVCKPLESRLPPAVRFRSKQIWETTRNAISRGFRGGLLYFHPDIFIFDNGADRALFGGDGHNDCSAGCVRLRSVAHRYNSQSLLLFTIVFARWTNCGLCVQRECGQQTGRHRDAQVGDSSRCRSVQTKLGWHLPLCLLCSALSFVNNARQIPQCRSVILFGS